VTALIDRLFDSYDRGRLSRRGLVRTWSATGCGARVCRDTLTVKSLNHVTLFVTDVERSRHFYQDLFTAPVVSSRLTASISLLARRVLSVFYKAGQGPHPSTTSAWVSTARWRLHPRCSQSTASNQASGIATV